MTLEMDDPNSLHGLRGLFQDLEAVSQSRQPDLDVLIADLEATLPEFRQLLDKPSRSDKSRQKLISGRCS